MLQTKQKEIRGNGSALALVSLVVCVFFLPSLLHAKAIDSPACPFVFELPDDPEPVIEEHLGQEVSSRYMSAEMRFGDGNLVVSCSSYLDEYWMRQLSGKGCALRLSADQRDICDKATLWEGHERLVLTRDLDDGGIVIGYQTRVANRGMMLIMVRGDPPYKRDTERLDRAVSSTRALIATIQPRAGVQ